MPYTRAAFFRDRIPVPVRLDFHSFESAFLPAFHHHIQESRLHTATFDLREVREADLPEMILLAAAAEHLRAKGWTTIRFHFGDLCSAERTHFVQFVQNWGLVGFLAERGFDSDWDQISGVDPTIVLPIRELTPITLGTVVEDIGTVLISLCPWIASKQVLSIATALVGEISENALDHAYPPSAATRRPLRVISARRVLAKRHDTKEYWFTFFSYFHEFTDYIELAVIDGGVGIAKSLRPQWRATISRKIREEQLREPFRAKLEDELACLRWVLSKNRSSRVRDLRRGYGLYSAKQHATIGRGGVMCLRSGHSRVIRLPEGASGTISDSDALQPFAGTQVRFFLPLVDRSREIQEVMDSLEKATGASS